MRRRALVPAVVAVVALVAGGGTAWARDARAQAATAGRERVEAAVTAVRHDEWQVSRLAVRSADVVGQDLLDAAHSALADLLPPASDALAASEGEVADEAVRARLAAAIQAAQGGLDGAAAPASSGALGDRLAQATTAVAAAHQEWLAQEAAQEAAAKAADEAARTSSGQVTGVPGTEPPGGCSVPAQPPFYPSVPGEAGDGSNGNLPRSAMAPLPWFDTHGNELWLVTAAARQLTALDAEFVAQFGHHIDVDITYRDYCTQLAMEQYYGYPRAARAGSSNHGLGRAIDIWEWPDQYGYGTPQHTWLAENGPRFGWYEQPPGGEYWHFDYRG